MPSKCELAQSFVIPARSKLKGPERGVVAPGPMRLLEVGPDHSLVVGVHPGHQRPVAPLPALASEDRNLLRRRQVVLRRRPEPEERRDQSHRCSCRCGRAPAPGRITSRCMHSPRAPASAPRCPRSSRGPGLPSRGVDVDDDARQIGHEHPRTGAFTNRDSCLRSAPFRPIG
jgi:hypothetical protein